MSSPPAALAQIVAALPDAAFLVIDGERLLSANDLARALLPGIREGDTLFRAIRAPEILDAIRDVRANSPQRAVWVSRVPVERWFDVFAASVTSTPPVTLVILRDATDLRRIERLRSDFVANASHELRTPLASVIGFIETLEGPARDDPAARDRFLSIMGEQARRMSRLIDDLLSLSRIEQNAHVRPQGSVDLAAVATSMCDALGPMARDGGVDIACTAPATVEVRGDRDDLLRVAENLIENAIKHGGPGRVNVEVIARDGWGTMIVQDGGSGIAHEHIPRLTERFYRVDNQTSRAKGGTGLGLALVKHIVAKHRGTLTIQSPTGAGARFSVSIPLFG